MWISIRRCSALTMAMLTLSVVAGCAGVPLAAGRAQVADLVRTRAGQGAADALALNARDQQSWRELLREPLQPATAVQIALLNNPVVQRQFATLGMHAADLFDAGRLRNPALDFAALWPVGAAAGTKLNAGATMGLGDLLLLHARERSAASEYRRAQELAAAAVLELVADVQSAWFDCVAAEQQAALSATAASTAATSAELAQRYVAAGNMDALTLQVQRAAAAEARIAAQRSAAGLAAARYLLQSLLGLGVDATWSLPDALPEPQPPGAGADDGLDPQRLQAQALQQRLDLAAARQHVAVLEAQLRTTRHWRLLATSDVGAAGEREADGSRRVGPSLSLALPLFNQGQGAMARASAELDDARAAQRQIELKIGAEVSWQAAQLSQASLQVQSYRDALLPARSAVVERLQERVNFMLDDAFTLLQAKQQEYAAHAGLIDATRDYWRARVELSRAAGGLLFEVQP